MLARFVDLFASRPRASVLLWLVILLFGVFAYTLFLPREGFPSVEVPIAVGAGGYFVDDIDVVDADVAAPLAEAAQARPEIESVQSYARASSFSIIANLESGVTSEEGAKVLDDVIANTALPPEAQVFTQTIDASKFLDEGYDLLIGVYGDVDSTPVELEAVAQAIVGDITHPDIALAQVEGLFDRGIDPATGDQVELEVSFNQLSGDDGVFRPSIAIGLKSQEGVDALGIRDATDIALAQVYERGNLPDGFEAVVAIDFATLVRQQVGSLQGNVLTGILAVAIIALLWISWRASIITALFILTVLAASVGALFLVGISLNTISLFALILALGLFVDDAIVITEAIDAFRSDGEDDRNVIKRAITRVGSASISGTLTTVLVFAPMLLIGGILGGFIRILPITVILSLLISLMLSLIFIPVASRFLVLRAPQPNGPLNRAEAWVADKVAALPGTSGGRGVVIGIAGFLLSIVMTGIGLFVLAPQVGFNIFPPAKDSINIAVEFTYEPGTTIEQARNIALEVNEQAKAVMGDELELGYLYIGDARSALVQYNLTPIGGRPTVHKFVEELQRDIADTRSDARVVFSVISGGPPELLFPFTMQVFGDDYETLALAAETLRQDLDGRTLELSTGESFNVLETDVAFDDVVARDDGRRYLEVRGRFDNASTTSTTATAQDYFETNYDAAGLAALGLEADALGFNFGLESENQESFSSLPFAFLIALGMMLLLLIVQFRSSIQWLLVFLAIPFSFFGVFGGLLLTDNSLSFFVMLGLIGLIGIAVNNTILLTDFANQERAAGADRRTAIASAIRQRFRPLVATSLTTVGGLLPLALSDPFWEGLSFTIIFGLLSSTFLVILSFPYYYLAIEWLRDLWAPPWRRRRAVADIVDTVEVAS